jgi:hypothetical protein
MNNLIDLAGHKFGRWTVIKRTENVGINTMWLCVCECGTVKAVSGNSLKRGSTKSCGCFNDERKRRTRKDLSGKRFGRLVVIKRLIGSEYKRSSWLCRCDCGQEVVVRRNGLVGGKTKSCGCIHAETGRETIKKAEIVRLETNANGYLFGTAACILTSTIFSTNTTGARGVSAKGDRFRARIRFKGVEYYLGSYETVEEAAAARKEAEEHIWGPFLEWYNNEYRKEYI